MIGRLFRTIDDRIYQLHMRWRERKCPHCGARRIGEARVILFGQHDTLTFYKCGAIASDAGCTPGETCDTKQRAEYMAAVHKSDLFQYIDFVLCMYRDNPVNQW